MSENIEKSETPDEFTSDGISRRAFVTGLAAAGALAACAPAAVATGAAPAPAPVPSNRVRSPQGRPLNVAVVGVGGMGMENMGQLVKAGENIVAVCDVDFPYVERSLVSRLRRRGDQAQAEARAVADAYHKAAKFADYREMLQRQTDIDGVVVATPDHLHAVIASAAMKAGKHVYVQKPLTYSVHEARHLARLAGETGVVTQMGNQGHSMDGTRRINELIASGILGRIREVHVWTDRPLRYWPQGIPRPAAPTSQQQTSQQAAAAQQSTQPTPGGAQGAQPADPAEGTALLAAVRARPAAHPRWSMGTVDNAVRRLMSEQPQSPPDGLNWDLYLGPAKEIPYHPAYHPFSWRGWVDFGVSAIGDMGAHLMDQPYWALGLTYPTSIVSSSTPWGGSPQNPGTYPMAQMTRYEFPAAGNRSYPVTLYWSDGGLFPHISADIPRPGGDGGGGIFVGERGYLTYETYGNNPKVYPESLAAQAERVPKTFPRVEGSHESNWAKACRGEVEVSCPFSYAAPLTETMLLGVVALRAGAGKKIMYDGANMRITNDEAANQWLTREYRPGWSL